MQAPHALVVGGSVGGLMTAAVLRHAGWRVDVFERSATPLYGRGGGLVLQGDVLRLLHHAAIGWHGTPGVTTIDRIWLDAQGNVARRVRMPQTQTSWNVLYGVLRDAQPAGTVHAGMTLAHYTQDAGGVTAHFTDGTTARGDLLVGADGARSTVRQGIYPALAPRYAGYVAWRGLVPESALPPAVHAQLDDVFAFQEGERSMLLTYPVPDAEGATVRGARRWNWVWYRPVADGAPLRELLTDRDGVAHEASLPPGALRDDALAALRRDAHQLAPALRALVDATDAPFVQAIVDLLAPGMHDGRVVLIGDAAAVVRPHTAGGTAKAAADALALARALPHGYDAAALAAWANSRHAQAQEMVRWGIGLGDNIMGVP
ncbi:hypothetical protein GO485_02610 [Pseudoduganella flava]|nr:hypothetical protein GO485_02610 [Pseudoduganella flava]